MSASCVPTNAWRGRCAHRYAPARNPRVLSPLPVTPGILELHQYRRRGGAHRAIGPRRHESRERWLPSIIPVCCPRRRIRPRSAGQPPRDPERPLALRIDRWLRAALAGDEWIELILGKYRGLSAMPADPGSVRPPRDETRLAVTRQADRDLGAPVGVGGVGRDRIAALRRLLRAHLHLSADLQLEISRKEAAPGAQRSRRGRARIAPMTGRWPPDRSRPPLFAGAGLSTPRTNHHRAGQVGLISHFVEIVTGPPARRPLDPRAPIRVVIRLWEGLSDLRRARSLTYAERTPVRGGDPA